MKIVFIITGLGLGGAEKQVCSLADHLAKNEEFDISIVSLTGPTVVTPQNKNIKIFELNIAKNLPSIIKAIFKFKSILSKIEPDIVHSHMFHANIFSRLLRITSRYPILINTAHSSNEGGALRMLAYRCTDMLSDLTTNVSKEAVEAFIHKRAVPAHKIRHVYNGIDIDQFKFDHSIRQSLRNSLGINNKYCLLAVGRLTKAKDYPNLLNAFASIKSKKDTFLIIIGDGELRHSLEKIINDLHLFHKVLLFGASNDIERWMNIADTFILPSAWEGFGLVVAEAMACERVVVATDCGGVREVIQNNGYIVPPRNSEELARAIEATISLDDHTRSKLGISARMHIVDNFSIKSIALQWLSIYKEKFH